MNLRQSLALAAAIAFTTACGEHDKNLDTASQNNRDTSQLTPYFAVYASRTTNEDGERILSLLTLTKEDYEGRVGEEAEEYARSRLEKNDPEDPNIVRKVMVPGEAPLPTSTFTF
jgi:hypothetical protein